MKAILCLDLFASDVAYNFTKKTFPVVRRTAIGGTFHRDALPKRKDPAKAKPYCNPYFADNEGGGIGTP